MSSGFDPGALKTLTDDPLNFYLKLTVLYGANKTGKSTMLIDIIHKLRKLIPMIYIFAGTPGAREAVKDIAPDRVIESEFTLERAQEIYDRQVNARATYDIANCVDTLQSLFLRVAGKEKLRVEKMVIDESKHAENIINASDIAPGEKRAQIKEIQKTTKEFLIKLYKNVIDENRGILGEMELAATEATALKFLHFNPNVLVIVDDCGAMISEKMQKTETFKNYFMMYRHVGITPIFTFQDDTELISKLRKQPSISIFTTQQCASAFFGRAANNLKNMQWEAERAINAVFERSNKVYPKHTKFIWVRDDDDPFRHYKAEEPPPFEFGCTALWKMCRKIDMQKKAVHAVSSNFGVYSKK